MTIFVSVIVVNYNSGTRLAKCIDHLNAQTFRNFEIIIVDNASSDGSADFLLSGDHLLIYSEANVGFSAANNLAAGRAAGAWLALLNPDAYAAPDWLEQLLKATEQFPDTDAFGSTQVNAGDPDCLDGAGDVYHAFGVPYRGHHGWPVAKTPSTGECFAPCAAAAFYRKSVFQSLGGFDESFFCYCEDIDLGFRLRLRGGRTVQVKDAVVLHEGSGITGVNSEFSIYHGHRNRIWTYLLNMPLALLIITLPFQIALSFYLLVRFSFLGRGRPYARGVKDAVLAVGPIWKRRGERQHNKTVTTLNIARALTWSPIKLFRKGADIRSIDRKQN